MASSKNEKIRNEIERTRRRATERDRQIEEDAEAIRKGYVVEPPQVGARVIYGEQIKELLGVAEGQAHLPPSFMKFITLWEAFNCWLRIPPEHGGQRRRPRDIDLLTDFKTNPVVQSNFQKMAEDSAEYRQVLANLKNLSPVYMVQGSVATSRAAKIDDETNLAQVIDVIYQIRNNLFHGAKSLYDQRDQNLVAVAHEVLLPLFRRLLGDSRATYYSREGE